VGLPLVVHMVAVALVVRPAGMGRCLVARGPHTAEVGTQRQGPQAEERKVHSLAVEGVFAG
jgi:hypothetical protein